MTAASDSSPSASSTRPASRKAAADSRRRLRSRRRIACSSSLPSFAAFCNSDSTRRSAPTRAFSPAFMAVVRSCLTLSAMLLMSLDCRPHHRTLPRLAAGACVVLTILAALLLTTAPARAVSIGTWNLPEQHAVRVAGLMHDRPDAAFHGERPLAGTELPDALDALATTLNLPAVNAPAGSVSLVTFDRLLVAPARRDRDRAAGPAHRLGGRPEPAAAVRHRGRRPRARPARQPPGRRGALRALPHRRDHPRRGRALARVALRWKGTAAQWAGDYFTNFTLPDYTDAQLQVLRLAVAKIGMPYIWGGETDTASAYFGGQVHGGYDCSGFAWRVFKLGHLTWGAQLHGRTAAQQAGRDPQGPTHTP